MLGKLSVPGCHTNLGNIRAKAYCACGRCGWGCLDIFSHFSFSLSRRRPDVDWNTVLKGR